MYVSKMLCGSYRYIIAYRLLILNTFADFYLYLIFEWQI